MDVLGAMGAILVAGAVLIPGAALVSLILRASRETANTALLALAFGVAAVLVGAGVYIVLQGVASIRQARWPKPSHQIDNRQQHIDARTQRVELPAGTRSLEP